MAQQEPLTQEREVYESHLEEWRQARLGKFVLIKDGDVLGFYESLEGAFNRSTSSPGRYDAVAISEMPNDEAVARVALANASGGAIRSETPRAFHRGRVPKDHHVTSMTGHSIRRLRTPVSLAPPLKR